MVYNGPEKRTEGGQDRGAWGVFTEPSSQDKKHVPFSQGLGMCSFRITGSGPVGPPAPLIMLLPSPPDVHVFLSKLSHLVRCWAVSHLDAGGGWHTRQVLQDLGQTKERRGCQPGDARETMVGLRLLRGGRMSRYWECLASATGAAVAVTGQMGRAFEKHPSWLNTGAATTDKRFLSVLGGCRACDLDVANKP